MTMATRSAQDLAEDRTSMAATRTLLAADRTLMAWVRTSLSMNSFGFTIYKVLDGFLSALGTAAIVMGILEYLTTIRPLRQRFSLLGVLCGLMALAAPARAQLNGSHLLGAFGVNSGSQPQPGVYAALFYFRYDTDEIRGANGETVRPFPGDPGSVVVNALAPMLWYVSKAEVLGANYGAFVAIPFATSSIEAPAIALSEAVDMSLADLLVRPVDLGWHMKRADVSAGLQFYAPTGRYERGGNENIGKGMWTWEPFVGTTVFLDEKKTVSLATVAYWEFHSKKEDSNTRVGQILTLQGGGGKSFLGGGLIIGAAYYGQWKLTEDVLGRFVLPGGREIVLDVDDTHRVFGFGPDVTLPVASRTKLFALVNIRYFWESGARMKTQGNNLLVTATFPIPSVTVK